VTTDALGTPSAGCTTDPAAAPGSAEGVGIGEPGRAPPAATIACAFRNRSACALATRFAALTPFVSFGVARSGAISAFSAVTFREGSARTASEAIPIAESEMRASAFTCALSFGCRSDRDVRTAGIFAKG
jgi:hypothetical protein